MTQPSFSIAPRKIRNVTLHGVRTCIGLEPDMWRALEDVAKRERTTLTRLIERIDAYRLASGDDSPISRLTPAIRLYLLNYYRAMAEGGKPRRGGSARAATPGEA